MSAESRDGQDCPQETLELRRRPRFVPRPGEAFVFLGSHAVVAGPILNISQGGLALRYMAGRRQTQGVHVLDIFVQNSDFCFERIPCRVVWDVTSPRDWSMGTFSVRHCGIGFGILTQEQNAEMFRFIESRCLALSSDVTNK